MSTAIFQKFCLLLLGLGITMAPGYGQQFRTVSAVDALEQIRARFGDGATQWIAELRATGGQPQPLQWDVISYDANATGVLHHYRASSGVVQDGGPDSRRYPADVPNGFFKVSDIGVDSVAAFTIAEAEARKARLGFDSCDYFLQLKEFSRETVWKLELVDATHRLVGSIYISGTNGAVLRTIWVQRDSISGFPRMIDSMTPGARNFSGVTDTEQTVISSSPPPYTGIAGMPQNTVQPPSDPYDPYAPVSPDGTVQRTPAPSVSVTPRQGGIFREFPSSGGGGSVPAFTPQTAPPAPAAPAPPVMTTPEPEIIPNDPIDSIITGPPIPVPSGNGSSARIPPPPVPQ